MSMVKKTSAKNAGFTLIEMILATGILASITAFTITMIANQLDTRNRIESQNKTYHMLHVAMSHVYDDLRHLQVQTQIMGSPSATSTALKDVLVWHGSSFDGLMYLITHNYQSFLPDSPQSNIAQVRYERRRDSANKEQLWRVLDTNLTDSISKNDIGIASLLVDDLIDFKVNFWDGQDFSTAADWDTTQNDYSGKIPKMAKIRLECFIPLSESEKQMRELNPNTETERKKIALETIVYILRSAGEEQLKQKSQEYKWR